MDFVRSQSMKMKSFFHYPILEFSKMDLPNLNAPKL